MKAECPDAAGADEGAACSGEPTPAAERRASSAAAPDDAAKGVENCSPCSGHLGDNDDDRIGDRKNDERF